MTVIRPNSISGITSITAQANEINIFRSDGTLAGLQINGIMFNNTSGISTLAALNVTGNVSIAGTLTYEDVTNVDSIGIITARAGINITGGNITLGDSSGSSDDRILLGASNDCHIHHNGTDTFISNDTGDLVLNNIGGNSDDIFIRSKDDITLQVQSSEDAIVCKGDGAVELYHNNVKKFETAVDRVNIAGHIFITDGSRIYLSNGFGNGHATIRNEAGNTAGNMVFTTRTAGGSDTSRAMFTTDGHFIPYANDTYDLGSTPSRWRNIYTTDLQLSNEGKTNDVDGTWGDYTIQEGESDLFLINNRSGKKYKFNLTEVS